MDHYQTLGVPRDASPDMIRAAFRELSRKLHPDTGGEPTAKRGATTKKFEAVKAAYDVLRDAKERAKYDELLAAAGQTPTPHFTWTNIAQPREGSKGGSGARSREDRPDLDVMIDAYFGRWNDPE